MTSLILTIALITACVIIAIGQRKYREQKKENKEKSSEIRSLQTTYGYAAEALVPFSKDMEGIDPKKLHHLGQPVDYIYFGDDKVIVFEIKTGNAKLNARQRKIKDMLERGDVEFKEIRIKR